MLCLSCPPLPLLSFLVFRNRKVVFKISTYWSETAQLANQEVAQEALPKVVARRCTTAHMYICVCVCGKNREEEHKKINISYNINRCHY